MSTGDFRRFAVPAVVLVAVCVTGAVVPAAGAAAPATPEVTTAPAETCNPQSSATVQIDPGARYNGYTTKTVCLAQGGTLYVVNNDSMRHSVTSDDDDAAGNKLFTVDVDPGDLDQVPGVDKLAPGSYSFYCHFHPSMRGTLVIEGSGGGVTPAPVSFDQPLAVPPVLSKAHLHIPIKQTRVRVLPTGPKTRMWTFGGTYPGPTIKRHTGNDTKVTFVNRLPKRAGSVTVHFHGDHHTSANDGEPTRHLIATGHRRTYDYPLTDGGRPERAAFDFYHDHRMMETTRNNWMGLQGMFITKDSKAGKLGLPDGHYDVPLMVSERSFTSDNQLVDHFPSHPMEKVTGPQAPPNDATVGDHILVDGRFAPYLDVATHVYRLRLLNSSAFTSYDFELSNGMPFVQVGTGDGLLPKAVVRQDILLGPAQRVDVLVDFRKSLGQHITLESVPRVDGPRKGIGTPTASIMQFRVTKSVTDDTQLPTKLQAAPKINVPSTVSATWTFDVHHNQQGQSYWTVNGKPYRPKRVDLLVPLGATQLWKLHNSSPMTHYVHIHEEQWHTVSRDGAKPPPWERGLIDTWRLDPGETVTVAAKFTDYAGVFMIHCHMLDHEDHGLMAQFAVVKPGRGAPKGYTYDRSASAAVTARAAIARMADVVSAALGTPITTGGRTTGGTTGGAIADASARRSLWCV